MLVVDGVCVCYWCVFDCCVVGWLCDLVLLGDFCVVECVGCVVLCE